MNGMTLFLLLLLAAGAPEANELQFRFIGNDGFEISDGTATILVDFPYQSGAFGYMSFDPAELEARSNALCLFTHRHADHFDPGALEGVGCAVAGPAEVLAKVDETLRLGDGPSWEFGQAQIECLDTVHNDLDHCSYVIHWHDRSIFFTGDVEELSGLFGLQEPLDVIILSSWLAPQAPQIRAKFPGAKIVISHHVAGEERALRSGCIVPVQGSSYSW